MSAPPDPKLPSLSELKGSPPKKAPVRPPLPPSRPASLPNQTPSLPNQDPYRQYWASPPVHPSTQELKRNKGAPNLPPKPPGPGNQ